MNNIILDIKTRVLNEKVIVACSTGVDSCVLLDLCMKALNKEQIVVAHVNHGVRDESKVEEEYINEFCEKNDLKPNHDSSNEDISYKMYYSVKKDNIHMAYEFVEGVTQNLVEFDYKIKSGDRIAQAVVFPVEGSGEYDGSYQEKEE